MKVSYRLSTQHILNLRLNIKPAVISLLLWTTLPFSLHAQEKKEVEIINADFLKFQEIDGKSYTRLVGNVQLKQEDMTMWCDSSLIDKQTNSVDAWGNIHIQQDTLHAYSNVLYYNGNTKFATLKGNARISDSKMRLYTSELYYDVKNKIAYYLTGGKVLRDSSVILSRRAYYYNNTAEVFFNGDVSITDPNYTLTSDTLKYNIETKRSTFFGNTEIINAGSRILCNNGWFDSERDLASFGKNTVVINPPQTLLADSLYYERSRGFGRAFYHFQWIDTSMDTELFGKYGEYSENRQFFMATRSPLLIYKMEKDSLFLTADTLKSMNRSAQDSVRNFYAYRNVRLYMNQMQGVCDSLYYSFEDSTFRFFYKPVLWSDDIQMSGEVINLKLRDKKADKLSIYKSGFIISPSGKKYHDQIKGINIFGYFKENELNRMDVETNAESLYFGKDEKGKFLGANKALSKDISIYFANKKIDRIVFKSKPEAVFTPTKMLKEDALQLEGFSWQIDRRPLSRSEFLK